MTSRRKLLLVVRPVLVIEDDRLVELNREALGNGKRLLQGGDQSPDNQMWLFAQHYPELIKKVGRLRRLSYLKAELAKEFPNEEFRFYANDNVIDIFNKQWDKFVEEDDKGITWWPIFVRARRVDASSAERGRKTKEGESAEVAEAPRRHQEKVSRVDDVQPIPPCQAVRGRRP